MSKHKKKVSNYLDVLSDNAHELLAATSDAAEEKVKEARKRLANALEGGREVYDQMRDKAAEGVRYADETVHESPYISILIAFLVGIVLAVLFSRRSD